MSTCLTCNEKCCSCGDNRTIRAYLTKSDVKKLETLGRSDLVTYEKYTGTSWISTNKNACKAFTEGGLCEIYPNRPEFCMLYPYNFLDVYISPGDSIRERQEALIQGTPQWDLDSLQTINPRELPNREMRVFVILNGCQYSRELDTEIIREGFIRNITWINKNKEMVPFLKSATIEQLELANSTGNIIAYCPADI